MLSVSKKDVNYNDVKNNYNAVKKNEKIEFSCRKMSGDKLLESPYDRQMMVELIMGSGESWFGNSTPNLIARNVNQAVSYPENVLKEAVKNNEKIEQSKKQSLIDPQKQLDPQKIVAELRKRPD